MRKTKVLFWVSTLIIFLFEGVMPALTSQSEMSIQGITHLGYPVYFVTMLTVFKVLGALALVIPKIPKNVKEWAYAGFGIDLIAAFWSIVVVDGWNATLLIPTLAFAILAVSYRQWKKLTWSV